MNTMNKPSTKQLTVQPRIAIVGLGNCASTLVQGLTYYRRSGDTVGLMHVDIGGMAVGDIGIACAFDVDGRKIGRRVAEAIFAKPNNSRIFERQPEDGGALVYAGPVADGVADHLRDEHNAQHVQVDAAATGAGSVEKVVDILKNTGANVLVNYLPVGSQRATELYAEACLQAGIGMVNCIPVFIASQPTWAERFARAGLPLVGDDVKSQFGATIVHRQLMMVAQQRGITVDTSYQLNVGGNNDFQNMLERGRLVSKKTSKTEAVTSQVRGGMKAENIHIGPSDYVPFLHDNKICYIRMNARGFGGLPMELDLKLSVEDSPNSAGIVVDAVRCAWLAQQRQQGGVLSMVSAVLMKHPPEQMADQDAAAGMDTWIQDGA